MEEKIKYRYFATGRTGTTQVYPANGRDFALSYTEIKERLDYQVSLSEKLIFKGGDFAWLYYLEKTLYRCDSIVLSIEKFCNNVWTPFFLGKMSLSSGDPWNLDKGIVELSVSESDLYDCIDSGQDMEFNLLNVVYPKVSVSTISGYIEEQSFNFSFVGPNGTPPNFFPGEPNPYDKAWGQSYIRYNYSDDLAGGRTSFTGFVTWVREVIYVPSGQLMPSPWIFIESQAGEDIYARKAILYNPVYNPYNPSSPEDYSVSYSVLDITIDNGLPLRKCIEGMLQVICPQLTIESDFFQWNPINVSNINYVTEEISQVNNIVMFQKSDVKRANSSNNATAFKTNFEDFINDICNTFQLKYGVTANNKFKIEHVDYYKDQGIGLDTTEADLTVFTRGNRAYSYDKDAIPKRETFLFMETSYGDFAGLPIVYSGSCAGQGDTKEIGYQVKNITTDVELCLSNPAPDSKVSDDGFVMIAADLGGGIYRLPAILGGNTLNNSLAWSYLHKNYWRHNRAQKTFTMNNMLTTAKSVKPTKLQVEFSIPFCCATFDPKKFIKTSLGDLGVLKSATYSLYTEKLKLSILHTADEGLTSNDAPVTIGDTATTFKNIPVIIDVLANDYDNDGSIIPSSLKLVFSPTHGTAVVTSDFKIQYTPTTGYVGADVIYYTVADDLSEVSVVTIVNVTVINGTSQVVANTDIYSVAKGAPLNIPAPGLLQNDTGPTVLSCVPETRLSEFGKTVQIFADGSFTYTAPSGSVGLPLLDRFTYTCRDINNNTAIGTAEIDCFDGDPVYVSLVRTSGVPQSIVEDCNGNITLVGSHTLSKYDLKFFSNPDKTTPLNVSSYGLVINVRYQFYEQSVLVNSYTVSYNATGTVLNIQTDYEDERHYQGCSGQGTTHSSISLSLLPGTGYNI